MITGTENSANTNPDAEQGEVRCDCGRLLGRLVDGVFEIRCRRCRRLVVLSLAPRNGLEDVVGKQTDSCQCAVEPQHPLEVEIVRVNSADR